MQAGASMLLLYAYKVSISNHEVGEQTSSVGSSS